MCRVLLIGEKYSQSDQLTKIEVGELMTKKRRVYKRRAYKNKKTYMKMFQNQSMEPSQNCSIGSAH